jgi:UDP-N-acetylglucosamine--N-acetylmuramyl-(pentapeptide) pyrophosphoryl-undecaprenol N-acetylglucosamine transferase
MILAGGTGGHVFPALAVAQALRRLGAEVFWMGTRSGIESRIVPAAGIPIDWIGVEGIRGKGWVAKWRSPVLLALALLRAFRILQVRKPNVILGMGGFVAGPGGVMGRLLGIPLVIHEQNRIPGTTNRLLARVAKEVLEAFPGSFPPDAGAVCTGNPLRQAIASLSSDPSGRDEEFMRILVLGGSQGAQALNRIVPPTLARLGAWDIEVWHQTGTVLEAETRDSYRRLAITARVDAFIEDMEAAYRWADLAICRSGAMTVSELAAAGLPAILVPYPYAIDDHQTANAQFLVDAGAARMIPQSELTADSLAVEIGHFLAERHLLREMGKRAESLARRDAADRIAAICLNEAGG